MEATDRVRLLFLDRDGTLNRTLGRRPPDAPEEVELLPGVTSVLARYVADGWRLVIVSNQGGVAGGFFSEAQAWAVQERVIELLDLPVAASHLCPHLPGGTVPEYAVDCPNRKPRPGFLLAALERFGARAEDCAFVGDSITDKQAAEAASVPFYWADRFFGRAIDRGLHTRDGRWVQVREVQASDVATLLDRGALGREPDWLPQDVDLIGPSGRILVASMRGQIVGWLELTRDGSRRSGDRALGVDPAVQTAGIETLLVEVAQELP